MKMTVRFNPIASLAASTAILVVMGSPAIAEQDDPLTPSEPMYAAEVPEEQSAAELQVGKLSILDAAPPLIYLLRNNPYVFGSPTTVVDGFANNTQLTGDWGGARWNAAETGVLFDISSTTILQGVVSGGEDNSNAATQSLDAWLNLDTGRLGAWPGGLFQFTFQSRFGSGVSVDTGAVSPVNAAAEYPINSSIENVGLVTEYYLLQALHPTVQLLLGKAIGTNVADQNAFASSYRYQFQNFAFNNNLMLGAYAPGLSTWAGAVIWQPAPWLSITTAALDTNGSAENFADDFFKDVTFLQEFGFNYQLEERPGNLRLGWVLTTKDSTDLDNPFTTRSDGRPDFRDGFNTTNESFMFYGNFDQFFYTIAPEQAEQPSESNDTPVETEPSEQNSAPPGPPLTPPRGMGAFGRFGIGPDDRNFISSFASFGIGGNGAIPSRPYDNFGLGWYYLGFSSDARDLPIAATVSPTNFSAENGMEIFYTAALTPAIQLTADAQYIFTPALTDSDNTLVLGGRLQINF